MDPEFARQYYESAAVEHWWFHGRRILVSQLLERSSVEAGVFADLGAGAESLFPSALDVVKLDVVVPQEVPDKFVRASADELPFADGVFDGVGLFDVLEHLKNPERCLAEVRRVVRPGGLVFVTVPAYKWLWSAHDDLVGHVRRYSPGDLTGLLESAGVRPVWESAFYGFLVLPGVVRAALPLRTSMSLPPSTINGVLRRVAESSVRRTMRRRTRFGLSLAAVAVVDRKCDS